MKLAFNVYSLFIIKSKAMSFIHKRRSILKPRFDGKESHVIPQDRVANARFETYIRYYEDGYDSSWRFKDRSQLPGFSSKFEFKKEEK